MSVLLMGAALLTICFAVVVLAFFSTALGRTTCRECGGELPVARLARHSETDVLGDWACPKCGTRFDRQGKARDQLAT